MMENAQKLYRLAQQKVKEKDTIQAIPLLKELLEMEEYNGRASSYLAQIYLQQNNYRLARWALNKKMDKDHNAFLNLMCELEFKEENFQSAMGYNESLLKKECTQNAAIYMLANIQRSLGEKRIAKNLYEILLDVQAYSERAFLSLCYLDLEDKNYQQLEKRLNQLNYNFLSSNMKVDYHLLCNVLDFYQNGNVNKNGSYVYNRWIQNREEDLLEHIMKHHETQDSFFYFLKYIDLRALIKLAEKQISISNPYYRVNVCHNIICADSIIGVQNGDTTNSFLAVTSCFNPTIVTMYPISVSKEFNKEGFREDKTVLAKRLGGGQVK